MRRTFAGLFALLTLIACEQREPVDLRTRSLHNRAAYIPPQCFTDVSASPSEPAQNPCYVCHAEAREPNLQAQPELQLQYAFPQLQAGRLVQNPWLNLFRDRREQIAAISDDSVRRYVSEDNYGVTAAGSFIAQRLRSLPAAWDADRNGRWDGYVPDARYHFDARGFDREPDGTPTGYRVFAYFPLPGGFTPASGSFDDVLIRLPPAFRTDSSGALDLAVYELNLAIVEALIRRQLVPIADKAYWLIVREQSFREGREPVLAPASRVRREIEADLATGITSVARAPRLAIDAQRPQQLGAADSGRTP